MNHITDQDRSFLDAAYQAAQQGKQEGGIPIGAVLVIDNQIKATGHNQRVQQLSMIKHGETDCIENTRRRISPAKMQQATLYTSLSPCFMCAGAILNNKIPRVVIGENQTFQESESFLQQHGVILLVANENRFISMMFDFIKENPKLWGEDIGLTKQQVLQKCRVD